MKSVFTVAKICQSGAVFQRRKPIRIWGTGEERKQVKAEFAGQICQTTVEQGTWEILFAPMETMEKAVLIISSGDETYRYENIAVGEVWIAGGQSNMEFTMKYEKNFPSAKKQEISADIRFYNVSNKSYDQQVCAEDGRDRWDIITKENLESMTAVGYYFARIVSEKLRVPVGIIGCNWGGTSALAWCDVERLRRNQKLKEIVDTYEESVKGLDIEEYQKKVKESERILNTPAAKEGIERYLYGGITMQEVNEFFRQYPEVYMAMQVPVGPWDKNWPGNLYEHMVKPISGYSVKGVLWYQGETDAVWADSYEMLFQEVTDSFREAWKDELPFLCVQLTSFEKFLVDSGERFPEVREQQALAQQNIKETYLVGTMDLGERFDIHPKQKQPIGERLARLALDKIYQAGETYHAPTGKRAFYRNGSLVIECDTGGEKLVLQGETLNGLQVLKEDAECGYSDVKICGGEIWIETKQGADEVRFSWLPYVEVNLFNETNLPVLPFKLKIGKEQ